ncbi:acetyl-CoA hydrolase/transferase C-terminal domain-containing protein [Zhongshania aquimaris]|uniref:Acetyl-CoA hydrolase n=1 Tax=Zhongshania aquimaris TaxID=2857107 RepID=A0ABS6VU65_9GAMM|nr:acetyl-CoA hydrolase/transferase C-terminal domain-containing protein [Zhongshania aquimaris]MBW2941859.1 acetyl-CoA hydrolase [Zhongshania aquimaris]
MSQSRAELNMVEIDHCVEQIIARLGNDLRVAMPLGLGKPVELIDALYRRACAEPSISLTILTALSLERPSEADAIRGRLLNPVFDRLYANYREPLYLQAERSGETPANIKVCEFYFKAGSRLGHLSAQRHYISSNYTHAARDVVARGCNVVIQMLAQEGDALSMSCNPDTSAEVVSRLKKEERPYIAIGVVHPDLPFMYGDAEVNASQFDFLAITNSECHGLFQVPRLPPIPDTDYAIGLRASALIADGGTLQLGIGAMGDAIVQSALLRHQQNASYLELLQRFGVDEYSADLVDAIGGREPFEEGLYGATEMFVEGFLHLFEAGVLKRPVYDFWALQQLINIGGCDPLALSSECLPALAELGVRELRGKDFDTLQYHGFFNESCRYSEGKLYTPQGDHCSANMANPDSQQFMARYCIGTHLRNGKVMHGGFFLGSGDFYRSLRDMPETERRKLAMCGVEKINQLDQNPRLYKAQRQSARFINTGLNVSLNGAVASDTLENGQVLSGVGGQYNFVAMAHQLDNGRSVLMIRASRSQGGKAVSNIVSHYGACTIPRHLRDIVVTEYGIADLRSKTDEEVCIALINIADSRFQAELVAEAKAAGKLSASFDVPTVFRQNFPHVIRANVAWARVKGMMPAYPFGCDFSEDELTAAKTLKSLAQLSTMQKMRTLLRGGKNTDSVNRVLEVLGLSGSLSGKDRVLKRLIQGSMNKK